MDAATVAGSGVNIRILIGDCREVLATLPDASVHCSITSPPYFGLRSYLAADHPLKPLEMGLEATPDEFVAGMVSVFREVRRVLRNDGTLWLNIGDSYAGSRCGPQGMLGEMADRSVASQRVMRAIDGGHRARSGVKPKDLIGIPWMLAFALRADGWYLRQEIIWHKPNPMPESVTDRCTKAHESLFLLSKAPRYYFDAAAIQEAASRPEGAGNLTHKGLTAYESGDEKMRTKVGLTQTGARETRNKRSVWTVPTQPFGEAHFATFPPALIEPCILAGCPVGGTVLDPFGGSGTTGMVAQKLARQAILIDLHPGYQPMMERRCLNGNVGLPLGATA